MSANAPEKHVMDLLDTSQSPNARIKREEDCHFIYLCFFDWQN